MSTWKRWTAVAGFALGVWIPTVAAPASAASDAPAVDPAALRILKQTTDLLDGLKQFKVTTQNIIEELHVSGHRVDYDLSANVTSSGRTSCAPMRTGKLMNAALLLRRQDPDALQPVREGLCDPGRAGDGREDDQLRARDGRDPASGRRPVLPQSLSADDAGPDPAVVVGKAVMGGVTCDHLLFVRPGVEFQIWVEDGARPWPRKYVVTETDTPEKLSITHGPDRLERRPGGGRRPVRLRAAGGDERDPLHPLRHDREVRALTREERNHETATQDRRSAQCALPAVPGTECPKRTRSAAEGPPSSSARPWARRRRQGPRPRRLRPSSRQRRPNSRRPRLSSRRPRPSSSWPPRRRRPPRPRRRRRPPRSRPPRPDPGRPSRRTRAAAGHRRGRPSRGMHCHPGGRRELLLLRRQLLPGRVRGQQPEVRHDEAEVRPSRTRRAG